MYNNNNVANQLRQVTNHWEKLWLKEITLQYYWCTFFSPVSQQHQTIRLHKKTRLTNSNIKKPNSSNIDLSNKQKFIYNLIINKKENTFFTDPQVSYYFYHLSPSSPSLFIINNNVITLLGTWNGFLLLRIIEDLRFIYGKDYVAITATIGILLLVWGSARSLLQKYVTASSLYSVEHHQGTCNWQK